MKQRKKTLTILMLFAMLLSTCGIMASAFCVEVEVEPVKPVTILELASGEARVQRYQRCPLCIYGQVSYSHTTRGEWCTSTNNACAHGDRRARDAEQVRGVVTYYTCDRCNFGTFDSSEEHRTVCRSNG